MPAYTYENFVTMNFLINFLVLKLNLCLKKKSGLIGLQMDLTS